VLQSLRTAVEENDIQHGLILSAIGSISRYHVHTVVTASFPPSDTFLQGEGPFDILSLTGLILDGRVHAHITFSDTEKAMGGHLEEGCRVLSFGVVLLAETSGIDLTGWDGIGQFLLPQ
jgi:predicted DNA-binding protein with PD1-like motif